MQAMPIIILKKNYLNIVYQISQVQYRYKYHIYLDDVMLAFDSVLEMTELAKITQNRRF